MTGLRTVPVEGATDERFRWAFEHALERSSLDPLTRWLLSRIAARANARTGMIPARYMPSVASLAAATGMCEKAVRNHLEKAEAAGWLVVERPEPKAGKQHSGRKSCFALVLPSVAAPEPPSAHQEGAAQPIPDQGPGTDTWGSTGDVLGVDANSVDSLGTTSPQSVDNSGEAGPADSVDNCPTLVPGTEVPRYQVPTTQTFAQTRTVNGSDRRSPYHRTSAPPEGDRAKILGAFARGQLAASRSDVPDCRPSATPFADLCLKCGGYSCGDRCSHLDDPLTLGGVLANLGRAA